MAQLTKLESLLEMGFDRNRVERAVANTEDQGIEEAMDWLTEHENDPDINEPYLPPVEKVLGGAATICTSDLTGDTANEENIQNAIDETNKRKRPLTEEEKRKQVKRLEELMRLKQVEQREQERAQEVEREKLRRRQGRELQLIHQKQQDDMKKQAERCRKDKLEDKQARQRVTEKIARDKERRAQKSGGVGPSSTAAPPQPTPSSPTSQAPLPSKKEYDESRIQVRLFDGSAITAVFKAEEPLAAVCVYVQENSNMPQGQEFTMLSPYPRHVYTEQDMETPLRELGLVPSAVLVLTKK
ncbi:UBX domain-containing protein 1-like isoform X2 [Genypterus blacodes]|uniref:UBX domain-containing protein 1-like isoform X2 n=1 Tax=Genypterus blacodes TaxID=154954 RepID=UPI003F757408